MKANLPEKNFFDSFYIWFNKEKREEYYSNGYNDKVVGYKRVVDFLNNFINKLEKTLNDNTHVQQI